MKRSACNDLRSEHRDGKCHRKVARYAMVKRQSRNGTEHERAIRVFVPCECPGWKENP